MSNNILYRHGAGLYINMTNRCPCACKFCLRTGGEGVNENESLWLEREPSGDELKNAISRVDLSQYKEVVFCGYGEPCEKLDVLIDAAEFIKEKSKRENATVIPIRINTNGLSDLINGKKTAALLAPYIDSVSISLNASTNERYVELCKPVFGDKAFEAVQTFALDCKKHIKKVCFTVVDILDADEMNDCKKICDKLGIELRVRKMILPISSPASPPGK